MRVSRKIASQIDGRGKGDSMVRAGGNVTSKDRK
jgi:hypothetical protein